MENLSSENTSDIVDEGMKKKEETGGERNEKVTRRITRAPTNRINQRR